MRSASREQEEGASGRRRVRSPEQIAGRSAPEQRPPSATLMLWPIVVHVAPLAEGGEVLVGVVAGVVIAMRGREHHPGWAQTSKVLEARQALESVPPSVTPTAGRGIPPASIAQMVDRLPVRPSASLAGASRPPEADHGGELRPVDRVVEAVLTPDRASRSGLPGCGGSLAACPSLGEVAVEGIPADPEALGDRRDRDRTGLQQSAPDFEIGIGELLRPATLPAAGQCRLQPFHRPFAVQVEKVLSHGPMHLQGEAGRERCRYRTAP